MCCQYRRARSQGRAFLSRCAYHRDHVRGPLRRHQLSHLVAVNGSDVAVGRQDQLAPVLMSLPLCDDLDIDATLDGGRDEGASKRSTGIARKVEPGTGSANRFFGIINCEDFGTWQWCLAPIGSLGRRIPFFQQRESLREYRHHESLFRLVAKGNNLPALKTDIAPCERLRLRSPQPGQPIKLNQVGGLVAGIGKGLPADVVHDGLKLREGGRLPDGFGLLPFIDSVRRVRCDQLVVNGEFEDRADFQEMQGVGGCSKLERCQPDHNVRLFDLAGGHILPLVPDALSDERFPLKRLGRLARRGGYQTVTQSANRDLARLGVDALLLFFEVQELALSLGQITSSETSFYLLAPYLYDRVV